MSDFNDNTSIIEGDAVQLCNDILYHYILFLCIYIFFSDKRVMKLLRDNNDLKKQLMLERENIKKLANENEQLKSKLSVYKKKCNDLENSIAEKERNLAEIVSELSNQYNKV